MNNAQQTTGTGQGARLPRASLALMALIATVLIFGTACSKGTFSHQRTEQWHFNATPETRLALSNVNGDIRVETREGNGIDVKAVIHARTPEDLKRLGVEAKQAGDRIILGRTSHKKGWFSPGGVDGRIDFIVRAPASLRLDEINTVSGDVTVLGNNSAVSVDAVNGDIDLQHMTGSVSVDVVNGDIEVQMQRMGPGQKVELNSVNGDMKVMLPADASARVEIDTVNGDIKAEGFNLKKSGGWIGKEAKVELGSGDALLSLDTVNGDMEIIKQ